MSQRSFPTSTVASGSSAGQSSATGPAPVVNVQEYSIRVPRDLKRHHHVMRFNATFNVDFAQWKNVKMERENNMREYRGMDEDMPKFGAGSEYNRDLREEMRRKKFGITARKYKPEAQPWILKVGGKSGKKFRGIREGGVSENAAFYVFTHAPDGAIEAYPLNEWYNFQPIQRYKALSAEEAEFEFGRRKRAMNYFQLMMRKRLKTDENESEDPEEAKTKLAGAGKKGKEFKISDADEWMSSQDESDSDDEDGDEKAKKKKEADSDDDGKGKAKKNKRPAKNDKKKKRDSDDEAFEESDDGDEEGRELDYISDSSDPESDLESKANKEMKSVAEEDALRKLLTSDEDSDEEKRSSDESNKEEEKNAKKETREKETNNKEKKKKKVAKKSKDDKKESLSDFSSDSSDSDADAKPTLKHKRLNGNSASNSRSASPSLSNIDGDSSMGTGSMGMKRKMFSMPTDLGLGGNSNGGSENSNSPTVTPAKKPKYDLPSVPTTFAGAISSKDDYGITEEAVRRYLMRKPMTTTELLQKFKNKKTGVSSEKLVETMTQILKKINPFKQTILGKMYLSIKINK